MKPQQPFVDVWRLVLEATAPLSIACGRADLVDDAVLVTTPSGLPFIPGTALAGVLRHALRQSDGAEAADQLFGHIRDEDGHASRFECSHAHIHDAADKVVTDLLAEPDPRDPILAPLAHGLPVKRQRVRLNAQGAAAATGHFDRSLVPAGHRFSVELRLWSESAESARAACLQLQGLLASPALRVGALTRSGFGALTVLRGAHRRFDLRIAGDLAAFVNRPAALGDTRSLQRMDLSPPAPAWATLALSLQSEGALRVGSGHMAHTPLGQAKLPQALPYTEPCVAWPADGKGLASRQDRIVIPATAIKGAFAHRLAFHDRRLRGQWASAEAVSAAMAEHAARAEGVEQWMGRISDGAGGEDAMPSQAGGLVFEDIALPAPGSQQVGHRTHNSLDRFTGGVRDGLLFTGEYLFRVPLETRLHLTPQARGRADAIGWQALRETLDDLVQGRLAIGADSAGGMGYLNGSYDLAAFEQLRAEALGEPA